ncbi:MAG: extracellular solute-binding protein [Patescibacteria group bacterium]
MFRSWRLLLIIIIALLILIAPLIYSIFINKGEKELLQSAKLEWWRITDKPSDLSAIIADYQIRHPQVSVNIKNIRPEEYELALLNAWAKDQGPDIVSLPVTGWRARQENLLPAPATLKVPYVTYEGFKKEMVVHRGTTRVPTTKELGELFVDTVKADTVVDGKIYGLPLALDTIVLYYNRDLLNKANLPQPASDWTEFKDHVSTLALIDKTGNFIQYGAALGEADNIPLAFELLSTLMMQNGTPMTNAAASKATFDQAITPTGQEYIPGEDALRFYTDFSNPTKEVYSWTEQESKSLDAFINGQLAYYFGFTSDLAIIRKQAPRLNISLTTFPQISGTNQPVYYADYYLEAVSAKTKYPNEAWDLVVFATTQADKTAKYLTLTKKPTALRALIPGQLEDFDLSSAALQLLSSRVWYRGYDPKVARQAMLAMIRAANAGANLTEALSLAAKQVSQTLVPSR